MDSVDRVPSFLRDLRDEIARYGLVALAATPFAVCYAILANAGKDSSFGRIAAIGIGLVAAKFAIATYERRKRVAEQIAVEDARRLLNTEQAALVAVFDQNLVAKLPLAIRNWDDLLALEAVVEGDRYTEEGGGRAGDLKPLVVRYCVVRDDLAWYGGFEPINQPSLQVAGRSRTSIVAGTIVSVLVMSHEPRAAPPLNVAIIGARAATAAASMNVIRIRPLS